MTEEEYQGRIRHAIADAIDYVDSNLAPDRFRNRRTSCRTTDQHEPSDRHAR